MNTKIIIGSASLIVAGLAMGGCAIPRSETLPPSPLPTQSAIESSPDPADEAMSILKENWASSSASDKDELCQYWKTSPYQAWEAFAQGESAGYISKAQFNAFFESQCL